MENDALIPKGPKPDRVKTDRIEHENYSNRENTDARPAIYDYEPLPQDPPMIVSNYGGIIPGQTQILIDPNNIQGESQKIPSDYSGYAWMSCLFCCFPLAIAAILKSDKVLQALKRGDISAAQVHSLAAKKFSSLAIIYGILFIVLTIGLYFLIATEVTHSL